MILIIISVLLDLDTAFEGNIRKNIIRLPSDFKTTLQLPCMKRRLIHVKSAWDCGQRLPGPVSMRISMGRAGQVNWSHISYKHHYSRVSSLVSFLFSWLLNWKALDKQTFQTSTLYFFLGGGGGVATYSCQGNSSHFRVFSTGSDHEKRPGHRFWDFPSRERHCESSEVFHTGSFTGIFTG